MTVYQVFDGVFLMNNDFHLRECVSGFQGAETRTERTIRKYLEVVELSEKQLKKLNMLRELAHMQALVL